MRLWSGEVLLGLLWVLKAVGKLTGRKALYIKPNLFLVRRTGLFDPAYYLDANEDVAEAGVDALYHYVSRGDREGRSPMALFDPTYYRSQVQSCAKSTNALLHYKHIGRYRRCSPSPWVDIEYYLRKNLDVERSGRDPLVHYLRWGGVEGRSPSPDFDGLFYLHTYADAVHSGLNPLVHYLIKGRAAGYRVMPVDQDIGGGANAGGSPLDSLSRFEDFAICQSRAGIESALVDVIVPVYKGYQETLRCLLSVLSAETAIPFELLVIDDCSPDSSLVKSLDELAGQGKFTMLSNSMNRGFVHSVNRCMALHKGRDVILLNSDTEVFDWWLDRLRETAYRNDATGTVTPLSNNATICSYPRFLNDNPYPLELKYSELDQLTAALNSGIEVEAPTGVGFCMYVRRDCLDVIGQFDEEAFGRGYGEENDFCQRAIEKGFRNIVTANVFVRHLGSVSFQGHKAPSVDRAMRQMSLRFPNYHADVREFISRDPLAEARRRLDWARLERYVKNRNVLIIGHDRGGGAERHVQEEIQKLNSQGIGVFRMMPKQGDSARIVFRHPSIKSLPNIPSVLFRNIQRLSRIMKRLRINEIHTHGLVDYLPEAPGYIDELARLAGVKFQVVLHDYKVICPRINLVDATGFYCGEPEPKVCDECLRIAGSGFGEKSILAWRNRHHHALRKADRVVVPSSDMSRRVKRYYPDVYTDVVPHEQIAPGSLELRKTKLRETEPLRVVLVGAISKIKGFNVLLASAQYARKHRLPIEFIVVGFGSNDQLLYKAGVKVTGRYQEQDALKKIEEVRPHAIWLPSIWPETYSYTLSIALQTGLPIFAFDIGAIAERLRELGRGDFLMPLGLAGYPRSIVQIFSRFQKHSLSRKTILSGSEPNDS